MKGISFILVVCMSQWLFTEIAAYLPIQVSLSKSERTINDPVDEGKEVNVAKDQEGEQYNCKVREADNHHLPEYIYEGPRIGNKCYLVSDQVFLKPEKYDDAVKQCRQFGGELAQPSLLEGSTFGPDIASQYGYLAGEKYWINGEGISNPSRITTGEGYVIPENSSRYQSVASVQKSNPTVDVNSRLTLVGPLKEKETQWFVDVADGSNPGSVYPFICEFKTVLV